MNRMKIDVFNHIFPRRFFDWFPDIKIVTHHISMFDGATTKRQASTGGSYDGDVDSTVYGVAEIYLPATAGSRNR